MQRKVARPKVTSRNRIRESKARLRCEETNHPNANLSEAGLSDQVVRGNGTRFAIARPLPTARTGQHDGCRVKRAISHTKGDDE